MKKNVANILLGISFIVIAVVCIIFSTQIESDGIFVNYETYGGDAYTGIQNAAAHAANNTIWLNETVASIGKYAFIIAGLVFAVIGIHYIVKRDKNSKNQDSVAYTNNNNSNAYNNNIYNNNPYNNNSYSDNNTNPPSSNN